MDGRVGLDVGDARVGAEGAEGRGRDDCRVALEGVPVDEADVDAVSRRVVGSDGRRVGAVLQHDDCPELTGAAGRGRRDQREDEQA
jgi:hypothetical protein